jgi:hypothetical protein
MVGACALASAFLGACAAAPLEIRESRAAVAEQLIDALVGDAACTADADCATIGIGALACGGPQAYRPWSRRVTDETALAAAAAEHRAERERAIAKSGAMSVCVVVPDPGARCSAAGRCELRARAADGLR